MKWKLAAIGLLVLVLTPALAYVLMNPEKNELNDDVRRQLGGTYIRLSQGVTHYRLEGPPSGRAVVLVHGATIPMWTWDSLIPVLTSAGYRVLSYDMYGRGYSDRPRVTYNQALYRGQLLELADRLGIGQPFDLVGLSMGGGIAVNFTAQYPDRVRKLVLIAPLISNFKVPSFFGIPVIGDFIARIAGIKVIVRRFQSLIAEHPNAARYTAAFEKQTTYRGFERSILSMLRNDAVRDYTPSYEKVGGQNRDTLLIWGTADVEITPEMIAGIRSLIPGVEFKPLEDAGHGLVFQQPDAVNRRISRFLSE